MKGINGHKWVGISGAAFLARDVSLWGSPILAISLGVTLCIHAL